MASRSGDGEEVMALSTSTSTGFLVLRTLRASLCSMALRSASTLDAFRTLVTAQGTAEGVAEHETITTASCSLLRDWRAFVIRGSRVVLPR